MEDLKEKVRRNRVRIIDQIRYCDIRDYLLQEQVLERHDDQEIKRNSPVERDEMSCFLSKLDAKDLNAHQHFIDSIRETSPHVVRTILETEIPRPAERIPLEGEIDQASIMQLSSNAMVMRSWEMIGRSLGVSDGDLQQIKFAQRDNNKECVYEMLSTWRNQNTSNVTTREAVYRALEAGGMRQAGDNVFYSRR